MCASFWFEKIFVVVVNDNYCLKKDGILIMGKWYEKRDEYKTRLIEATIKTVATVGLEQASVDLICKNAGMNVVYVYRLFGSKDKLLLSTFEMVDTELLYFILNNFIQIDQSQVEFEQSCRALLNCCWEYVVGRPDKLRFYVRYYHSAVFHANGYDEHIKRFSVLLEKIQPAFRDNSDVTMVMHQIFETMLIQSINHIAHPMGSNQAARDLCFNMVFSIAKAFRKA